MGTRRTFRIELAYDGAAFFGFARQPGLCTVEGVLREALTPLVGKVPTVVVAGRTDRGVSATGQTVSFRAHHPIPLETIREAIDHAMPEALTSLDVREVPRWFHAQFSARARRYVYRIEDPGVDVSKMDRMLAALVGLRDFHAFARDTPKNKTTVRRLFDARVRHDGDDMIRFDFGANAFLRRQIRVLTATTIHCAREHDDDDALVRIAATRDRRMSAPPLPPDGLVLARVIY